MNPKPPEAPETPEDLNSAKAQWQESEWRLNFLRTITDKPPPIPDPNKLMEWYQATNHEPHHGIILPPTATQTL